MFTFLAEPCCLHCLSVSVIALLSTASSAESDLHKPSEFTEYFYMLLLHVSQIISKIKTDLFTLLVHVPCHVKHDSYSVT